VQLARSYSFQSKSQRAVAIIKNNGKLSSSFFASCSLPPIGKRLRTVKTHRSVQVQGVKRNTDRQEHRSRGQPSRQAGAGVASTNGRTEQTKHGPSKQPVPSKAKPFKATSTEGYDPRQGRREPGQQQQQPGPVAARRGPWCKQDPNGRRRRDPRAPDRPNLRIGSWLASYLGAERRRRRRLGGTGREGRRPPAGECSAAASGSGGTGTGLRGWKRGVFGWASRG
jgi:hypothetical protein